MTSFTKITTLIVGTTLLTLAACSTATPAKNHKANMQGKHQMMGDSHMGGEHKDMMQQMKMDHDMMSKMDMSQMDMSKLSTECKTMMTKMKAKMADKHKDGGMKDHDMSKMGDHDMMQDHNPEKMQTMMAKHKKCMVEMKEAMPHSY